MAATRRQDIEEYVQAMALAREVRAEAAEQLRDLIIDSDRMGSRGEVAERIQLLVNVERRLSQAQGQEVQARDLGMPTAPSVEAQRELRSLRRETVMGLALAAAGWAAAMDLEQRQVPARSTRERGADDGEAG